MKTQPDTSVILTAFCFKFQNNFYNIIYFIGLRNTNDLILKPLLKFFMMSLLLMMFWRRASSFTKMKRRTGNYYHVNNYHYDDDSLVDRYSK